MNFGNVACSATVAYLLKEIKFAKEGKIPVGGVPDDIELVSYLAVSDRARTDGEFEDSALPRSSISLRKTSP